MWRNRDRTLRSRDFAGSRPDVISDPNLGPHTVEAMGITQRVPQTGRNHRGRPIRKCGPEHRTRAGTGDCGCSVFKTWQTGEAIRWQLRIEGFNILNHANFGVPVNDLVSPNFGRIIESGPPRVFQAGLKLLF